MCYLKKNLLKYILSSMSQILRSLILAQGYYEFLGCLYSHGEVWVACAFFSFCIILVTPSLLSLASSYAPTKANI